MRRRVPVEAARREVRRLIRHAERQPRGPARDRKTTRLVYKVAELIYFERLDALDELERARLTEGDLVGMRNAVTVQDVQERLTLMRPGAGIEVPR